ncbi:MAG: hypothetical protein ABI361_10355 [Nitrososphaera sp.]|jgi:hypothetical protein
MAPKEEQPSGYGPAMKTVALSILVMGISLSIVIVLYIWFGHIGPTFSSERLVQQQAQLRDQYGLPKQPPVPTSLLNVPPSLRNITQAGNTTK